MAEQDNDTPRPATLDNGFNVVARDLDRAFALGLSPNQAVIVNMVRELGWDARWTLDGDRRPAVPVRVNLTHLARETGLNRSRLSTALKGLIAGRVLGETPDGYLIQKDYRKWLADDAPGDEEAARRGIDLGAHARFTATELRYIRAAKKSANHASDKKPSTVAKRNGGVLQNATALLQNATVGEAPLLQNATALLQNATPTVAKRNSATIEDARAELREREITDSAAPAPPTRTRIAGHQQAIDQAAASFGADHPFVAVVAASGQDIGRTTGGRFDCYAAAVRFAARSRTPIANPHPWCLKLAVRFAAEGIPPEPTPLPPVNGHAPADPPSVARRKAIQAQFAAAQAEIDRQLAAEAAAPDGGDHGPR